MPWDPEIYNQFKNIRYKPFFDLVELISQYVPLRRAGKDFKGLCPFHAEKTPSFTVSAEKGFYKTLLTPVDLGVWSLSSSLY